MNAREPVAIGIGGQAKKLVKPVAPSQLELRLEPNPLIRMGEQIDEERIRVAAEIATEQLGDLFALLRFSNRRIVDHPDAAKFVGLPFAVPIGDVQRAVRAEVDRAGHHPKQENVFIDHFEIRSLWLGLEGGHLLHGKLAQEKRALIAVVQCRTRVVLETTRANGKFAHRRRDVGGLPGPVRKPKFFIDPRTILRCLGASWPAAFFELPVQTPAGIAPLSNVDEPFAFLADVAVVVHREQVAELVES